MADKNSADQIADLLFGAENKEEDSNEEATVEDEDSEEGSTQSEESSEDNNEEKSDEETDKEDTSEEESEEELSWATALGIDDNKVVVDDDGKLAGVNVKVDGKVETVSVNDLIAGYQSNKSNTNKSKAVAAERKEFESLRNSVAMEYKQKLEEVSKLSSHLEDKLVGDFQNVNWAALRYDNPAEYAALAQDYQIRSSEIERIKAAVVAEKDAVNQEQQAKQSELSAEYIRAQADKVLENNPDWAKPDVAKKALGGIKSFISETYGFDENDFATIQDARIIEVLKDAMAYRNGKKFAEKKLALPIPKVTKMPNRKTAQPSKVAQLTKAAKSEGNVTKRRKLEVDAISQLLMGG